MIVNIYLPGDWGLGDEKLFLIAGCHREHDLGTDDNMNTEKSRSVTTHLCVIFQDLARCRSGRVDCESLVVIGHSSRFASALVDPGISLEVQLCLLIFIRRGTPAYTLAHIECILGSIRCLRPIEIETCIEYQNDQPRARREAFVPDMSTSENNPNLSRE